MAIYGHKFDSLVYTNSLTVALDSIEESNKFLSSLSDKTVILEGSFKDTISNFKKRIRKIIENVLNFLKSIPGRIKELFNKIFKKNEEIKEVTEEIKEKEKDSEFEFEDKEFEDDIINYDELAWCFFDRSNFIMDQTAEGYKSFVGDGLKNCLDRWENNYGEMINHNYFYKCGTKQEFLHYISSKEFIDKFRWTNKKASYIRDNIEKLTKQSEYLNDLQKRAIEYRDSWQTISKDIMKYMDDNEEKFDEEKVKENDLDSEKLANYLKFCTYSTEACIRVINTAMNYVPIAIVQADKAVKFVESCYKKKAEESENNN